MRSAAATLILFSGYLQAHSGHGALGGHFHGVDLQHVLLLALVLALLAYAVKK